MLHNASCGFHCTMCIDGIPTVPLLWSMRNTIVEYEGCSWYIQHTPNGNHQSPLQRFASFRRNKKHRKVTRSLSYPNIREQRGVFHVSSSFPQNEGPFVALGRGVTGGGVTGGGVTAHPNSESEHFSCEITGDRLWILWWPKSLGGPTAPPPLHRHRRLRPRWSRPRPRSPRPRRPRRRRAACEGDPRRRGTASATRLAE